MHRFAVCMAFGFIAFVATAPAWAQDAAGAHAFVESLYRQYSKDGPGIPSQGPKAHNFYHSSLLALMRADEKAVKGEVGALDGDPVCGCQDWNGIWNLNISIDMKSPDRALTQVTFTLAAPAEARPDDTRNLLMTLLPENGQWRIWNIRDDSDPKHPFDVRKELGNEIERLTKRTRHTP